MTLYSNYYSENVYEETKQYLIEDHNEENDPTDEYEPTENEIFDAVSFQDEMNWDDFKDELEGFIKGNDWILQGDVGTWRGQRRGGFIFSDVNELYQAWEDCDYIEFRDERGHLYLRCSQHDGTNAFEIKRLTDRGYEYSENHDDDDEKTHNTIFSSNFYSALPHFAKTIYGCKEKRRS